MTKIPEFKQMEIDKLRAELDHCRNSLVTAIDTSNHWSDAHATAYARGYAAGLEQANARAERLAAENIQLRVGLSDVKLLAAADMLKPEQVIAIIDMALAAPPAAE